MIRSLGYVLLLDLCIMIISLGYYGGAFYGHLIILIILVTSSIYASIYSFRRKKRMLGTLFFANIFIGTFLADIFMFRIEDAIYHINNKEYTFDNQKGSHAIYIRKDKQECQICDYKHCNSITEYSNYRDGKFHEVNTNTYELCFEDGDTLIISNDTLYGYSDNPILLKRK